MPRPSGFVPHGVIPAVILPFHGDFSIDEPSFRSHLRDIAAVEGLSANMMEAWLAFARTGDPSHEGIGSWPAYDAESRPTMIFDAESRLEMDPFGEERQAIEALVP